LVPVLLYLLVVTLGIRLLQVIITRIGTGKEGVLDGDPRYRVLCIYADGLAGNQGSGDSSVSRVAVYSDTAIL
jgi:hypothetical protein